MILAIYIENEKIDLFKDENISINSSVAKIEDITKNSTEYSNSFTVPATHRNNRIFKHYYDIQFTGNLFSLKDTFKNDELSVLDLSAYNHEYNSDNVKEGLTDGLFSGDVVYPLMAKKQYYYNSNATDDTYTPTLSNLHYEVGNTNGITWNELRPSIKLLPIIEAIESKYNISFSRDFFGREEVSNIFLWVNNSITASGNQTEQLINWDSGNGGDFGLSNTTDIWNGNTNDNGIAGGFYYQYKIEVTPSVGFESKTYEVVVKNFDSDIARIEFTGTGETEFLTIRTNTLIDFQYSFYVSCSESFEYSANILLRKKTQVTGGSYSTFDRQSFASSNLLIDTFDVSANLPNIKILDFLTGLFKMFKLVVIADDRSNVYVNTLKDYYAQGSLINVTKWIDAENVEVEKGKILNNIQYAFQEPTTLLNQQFEKNTGQGYGDEDLQLEDSDGNPLVGDSLDYTLPFEQIVYERLNDINNGTQTNIQYGLITDENISPANPKPHLHYVNKTEIGSSTVAFINDASAVEELTTFLNLPSHSYGFDTPEFVLLFGREFSTWDFVAMDDNLYTNYHSDYIQSIFNIKKRNFKYKAKNFPLLRLLKLGLNDVLQIKNNYYRINSYDINLTTKEVQFDLINSFDNTLNSFNANRTLIITDYTAKTESVYVTNLGNFSFNIIDTGFGDTWVSVTSVGDNVYFAIDENATGLQRNLQVELTNLDSLQIITITIEQGFTTLTADSSVVTADSNLITADNG